MCLMEQVLWSEKQYENVNLVCKKIPKVTIKKQVLLSALVRGSSDATALVTAAAISLCPLLSTEGSLRLSAGARPSVGKLLSTVACCAAA